MTATRTIPAARIRLVALLAALVTLLVTALAPAAHAGPVITPGGGVITHFFPRAVLTIPSSPTTNPASALVGDNVRINAASSSGGLYAISKYEWDLDGNGSYETTTYTTTEITKTFANPGSFLLHLRVTNSHNQTATTSAVLVVHRAPHAAFTASPKPATAGFPVKFDATDSSDDNGAVSYGWDLDGNGTYETFTGSPNTTRTFPTAGVYTVGLEAIDKYGAKDFVVHQVEVVADTVAPVVTITPGSVKLRGRTVTLRVACPATELRCTGDLSLAPATKAARAARFTPAHFGIIGGDSAAVQVKVSKATAKLIKRLHRIRATASATAQDAAGNNGTATKSLKITR